MAYANNITRLTELAVRDYIRGIGLTTIDAASMFATMDDTTLTDPRVVVSCQRAEINGNPDDAIWECQVEIQVVHDADTSGEDDHHNAAGEIFSQFFIGADATAQAISDARADFHCQRVFASAQVHAFEDRKWVSSLGLRMICCGIDIG